MLGGGPKDSQQLLKHPLQSSVGSQELPTTTKVSYNYMYCSCRCPRNSQQLPRYPITTCTCTVAVGVPGTPTIAEVPSKIICGGPRDSLQLPRYPITTCTVAVGVPGTPYNYWLKVPTTTSCVGSQGLLSIMYNYWGTLYSQLWGSQGLPTTIKAPSITSYGGSRDSLQLLTQGTLYNQLCWVTGTPVHNVQLLRYPLQPAVGISGTHY